MDISTLVTIWAAPQLGQLGSVMNSGFLKRVISWLMNKDQHTWTQAHEKQHWWYLCRRTEAVSQSLSIIQSDGFQTPPSLRVAGVTLGSSLLLLRHLLSFVMGFIFDTSSSPPQLYTLFDSVFIKKLETSCTYGGKNPFIYPKLPRRVLSPKEKLFVLKFVVQLCPTFLWNPSIYNLLCSAPPADPNTLFRSNSLASKAMEQFMKVSQGSFISSSISLCSFK